VDAYFLIIALLFFRDADELRIDALGLTDDVDDDYSSIMKVRSRFENWKSQYPKDYKDAFGALSTPATFEFYVRCQLVGWDPLTVCFPAINFFLKRITMLTLTVLTYFHAWF
jgi:hypothetical protein